VEECSLHGVDELRLVEVHERVEVSVLVVRLDSSLFGTTLGDIGVPVDDLQVVVISSLV